MCQAGFYGASYGQSNPGVWRLRALVCICFCSCGELSCVSCFVRACMCFAPPFHTHVPLGRLSPSFCPRRVQSASFCACVWLPCPLVCLLVCFAVLPHQPAPASATLATTVRRAPPHQHNTPVATRRCFVWKAPASLSQSTPRMHLHPSPTLLPTFLFSLLLSTSPVRFSFPTFYRVPLLTL